MQTYAITQNSAAYPLVFLLVQSSDHISPLTGATPTVTISKNGAAFAAPSGAVSEIGNGWYKVAGNATDTNTLGPLLLHATAASGDPADVLYPIVAYSPQAGTNLGLSALPTASPAAANGLLTVGTGAGQLSPSAGGVDVQTIKTQSITCAAGVTILPNVGASGSPGAANGVLIAGANAATTIAGLTLSGANAVGGSPAAAGLTIAGGAASTSVGGFAGPGVSITGGASASGTNIAALGIACAAGQSNFSGAGNDGAKFSGTGNGHGVTLAHAGTGLDLNAQTTNALQVNAVQVNGVSTSPVTTIGANVGTTQPINFTGAGAQALVKSDTIDWNSVAVGGMPNAGNVTVGGYAAGQDPATLVLDVAASSHNTAGTVGAKINSAGSAGDPWSTALPGAYAAGTAGNILGNRLDVAVSTRLATSGYTAPLTQAQVATAVWTDATAGDFAATGSIGKALFTGPPSWYTAPTVPPTAAAIATAVWTDTTASDFTAASSPGKVLVGQLGGAFTTASSSVYTAAALANAPGGGSAPTAAQVATAVWQDLTAGADFATAGSIGKLLATNIDAAVSSRLATAGYTAPPSAAAIAATTWADLTAGADFATAGSIGKLLATNLDANVGSRAATAALPANFSVLAIDATGSVKVQGSVKRGVALPAFEFPMALSADHYSPATGKTVTATRSLDGAAFAACANAPIEVGGGIYRIDLAATDLSAGVVTLQFAATGCDTTTITVVTQP